MNAFGEALNLGFMRRSGDFSSGSMPMDSISGCIPMSSSSYSPANGLNLRLHSHEFKSLFPANESQTAFPWVPIPKPMNLRLHSHEFKSLFPSQWISGCIPMSPYSPAKFLESFGWVPPMSCHPDSKRVHRRSKKLHSGAILGVPLYIPHGYP